MDEPEKPFACTIPDCGMTFTNEDHLTVHTKKHDMYLQLGLEQKAAFVADQTPTPTRFIRNCEEVGLFQDLQNVNPFEEGFKRAMETCKHGLLTLENAGPSSTSDDLHTPQMVFPTLDGSDATLYTSNNRKNITISRSSSDESGTIKEYETTTISKLTNQVTTISRVVNKHDIIDKHTDETHKTDEHTRQRDVHNETSVSYTNNVIKIQNNIEIRKDNLNNVETTKNAPSSRVTYDTVAKDASATSMKDVLLAEASKAEMEPKLPSIMSQRSIDSVINNLTSEICGNHKCKPDVKMKNRRTVKSRPKLTPVANNPTADTNLISKSDKAKDAPNKSTPVNGTNDNYEVVIKLPTGRRVVMKAVDEISTDPLDTYKIDEKTKEKLKLAINNKVTQKNLQMLSNVPAPMQGLLPITTGTLIPITILNPATVAVHKIPIAPFNPKASQEFKNTAKRKIDDIVVAKTSEKKKSRAGNGKVSDKAINGDDDCVIVDEQLKKQKRDLDSRVAASRRYRVRLRENMKRQESEIKQLKEANQALAAERSLLKILITEHMRKCPNPGDLRSAQEKLAQLSKNQ
ncbi:hypothetical protein evm_005597 [Chilo suppressalis]|nr:hypothetical protein evm_005597 [Chilo suppressalis]